VAKALLICIETKTTMNAAMANHNTFLLRLKNAPKSNMKASQTQKV
jgi:hypothetical protein